MALRATPMPSARQWLPGGDKDVFDAKLCHLIAIQPAVCEQLDVAALLQIIQAIIHDARPSREAGKLLSFATRPPNSAEASAKVT